MWLVSVGKVGIFSVGTLVFGLLWCSKGKLKGFSNEGLAWSDLSKLFLHYYLLRYKGRIMIVCLL